VNDVVTGALIGAGAVVAGGIVAGAFDFRARAQDRKHDSAERAADRKAAADGRSEERTAANKASREERDASERALWRERAAVTLGQVYEFAGDVHPANATAIIPQHLAQAKGEDLVEKWNALRGPFGVLIAGLPTTTERDLAADVMERFRKIHNGLGWVLQDIASDKRDNATILGLQEDWDVASAKLHELREAIHG
jgi:hypothetical protein